MSVVASSVDFMNDDLPDLDADGLLAAASGAVRARRLAEVRDLEVLAQWAAVHSGEPTHPRDVLVQLGGEGTPRVQEFCLGEIALARGTGVMATINATADVLDLLYRLPETWAVCEAGGADLYVARRVAKLSRHLPADRVGVVDRAVARIIAAESGGRVLAVAEAKIIEADPGLHDERVEAERRRRYVSSGRTDEFGLRTVIARVEAGDAVWVEAIVARVAEILAPRYPDASADELRSIAFGWLARPAELLRCCWSTATSRRPSTSTWVMTRRRAGRRRSRPTCSTRCVTPTCRRWHPRRCSTSTSTRPPSRRGGVARVEGLGPVTLTGLQALLARTDLTVKPVLDLSDRVRTTAYEHPESLKERVHLVTGGDYWPYATSTTRRVDYDHPIPHDATARRARPAPTTPARWVVDITARRPTPATAPDNAARAATSG